MFVQVIFVVDTVCSNLLQILLKQTILAYFLTKSYSQAMFFSLLIYNAKFFPQMTNFLLVARLNTFLYQFIFNDKTNVHCSLLTLILIQTYARFKRVYLKSPYQVLDTKYGHCY